MDAFSDAARYAREAGFVADLAASLVDLLAPRPGERILDLGCGDGRLSAAIAARGARVVGIDRSPAMVAAARERGIEAHELDAAALPFAAAFDAVFSNAALHWMGPVMEAVLAGVFRALRPGGRFVGEMGGFGNIAAITTALRATLARRGIDARPRLPWIFPTAAAWRARLERQGFRVESCELIPRPTRLEAGMAAWLELFAADLLALAPADQRPVLVAEILELLAPALRAEDGTWYADYVRLRFRALKPEESR